MYNLVKRFARKFKLSDNSSDTIIVDDSVGNTSKLIHKSRNSLHIRRFGLKWVITMM